MADDAVRLEEVGGDLGVARKLYVGGETNLGGDAVAEKDLEVKGWLKAPNIIGIQQYLDAAYAEWIDEVESLVEGTKSEEWPKIRTYVEGKVGDLWDRVQTYVESGNGNTAASLKAYIDRELARLDGELRDMVEESVGSLSQRVDEGFAALVDRYLSKEHDDTAAGHITLGGGATIPVGKTLRIGEAILSWDAANGALRISSSAYSEGGVSALGVSGTMGGVVGGGSVSGLQFYSWAEIQQGLVGSTSEGGGSVATAYAVQKIYDSLAGLAAKTDINDMATKTWVGSQGYLTSITKSMVEGVLTGNITSHSHSQYLTGHQTIYGLTIKADGTTVAAYQPSVSAQSVTFESGDNIALDASVSGKVRISNTYSYVHPTDGAGVVIGNAVGKVLSSIAVDSMGHVTAVSGKSLTAADIPALDWSKITTGKPTTLSGYGITDAYTKTEVDSNFVTLATEQTITGMKTFASGLTVGANKKIYFGDTDHFVEVDSEGNFHFSHSLYSEGGISALGMSGTTTSGGGASYASVGWDAIKTQGQESEMTTLATAYAARKIWDETQSVSSRVGVLEARTYAKLTVNGTTYDPMGNDKTITITAASIGALTGITKSMVEGVLTGNITSHSHSQYLTGHQTIYALTLAAGAFTGKTYDPKSSAQSVNIPTSTDHISEGSNKYYTDARVDARVVAKVTKAYVDGLGIAAATAVNATNATNATNAANTHGGLIGVDTVIAKPDNGGRDCYWLFSDCTDSWTTEAYVHRGFVGTIQGFRAGNMAGSTIAMVSAQITRRLTSPTMRMYSTSEEYVPCIVGYEGRYYVAIKCISSDRQMCLSGRFATKLAEPFWLMVAQGATLPEGMTLEKEGEQMPMTVRFKVARKLWGQTFDGTADVSGDMTGVGNITASGHISTTSHITANGNITAKTNLYVSADTSLHRILIGNQNGDGANCPPIIEGVDGYLRIGSGTSWSGGGTLNIAAVFHSSGVTIHKALMPSEDNAKTLGTSSKRWSEMYAAKAIVSELRVGDAVISWDATNNALKVSKTLYSEGGISAMGMSGTTTSGAGASYASVGWDAIKTQGQESEMTTLATAYAARKIWDETQSVSARVGVLEARTFAKLTVNGTTYDPMGNDKTVTITAASIGALTSVTKSMVEGVLTGNITSHSHSQYLTGHQTIYALTLAAGAFTGKTYDPKSSAQSVNIPTSTDHISEGSNKYYTDARVDARVVAKVTKAYVDSLGVNAATLQGYTRASLYETRDKWYEAAQLTETIMIHGESDTYYPVVITPQSNTKYDAYRISVWKNLGSPTADYEGNHSTGHTSSLWLLFEGRRTYWDGNGGFYRTIYVSQGYATLCAKADRDTRNDGGLVVWLRGGGTEYKVTAPVKLVVRVLMEETNLNTDASPYVVAPMTTLDNCGVIEGRWYGAATKLATKRTLWGQQFDGTGNVAGTLSDVWHIIPMSDAASQLGTAEKRFSQGFIKNVHIGADGAIKGRNNATILLDHSNGNISLSAVGNGLYLGYNNTSTIYLCGNNSISPQLEVGVNGIVASSQVKFNGSALVPDGKYLRIGEAYLSWDSSARALRVSANADGSGAMHLYATGSVSAMGASSGSGSVGISGLSSRSYADIIGGEPTDESMTEFATAYATRMLWEDARSAIGGLVGRVSSLEGGSALSVTMSGAGNVVTSVVKTGTTISVTRGITALPTSGGTMTGNVMWEDKTGTLTRLPSHIYRNFYDDSGNVFDQYFPNGSQTPQYSYANLRVKDGNSSKTLRFGGDGTFTWNGNTVLTSSNIGSVVNKAYVDALNVAAPELKDTAETDVNQCMSDLRLRLYSNINKVTGSDGKVYAGTYGFPAGSNANGLLWMGVHRGGFGGQLGISSDHYLYYRFVTSSGMPTTTNGASWKRIAFTDSNITGSAASATTLGITLSGTTNLDALQDNLDDIPKVSPTAIRIMHGSQAVAFGYQLGGQYASVDKAYGGWFVADYSTPKYIGIGDGTWTESVLLHSNNFRSYITKSYIDGLGIAAATAVNATNATNATNAANTHGGLIGVDTVIAKPDNGGRDCYWLFSDCTDSWTTEAYVHRGFVGTIQGFRAGNMAGSTIAMVSAQITRRLTYPTMRMYSTSEEYVPCIVGYEGRYYVAIKCISSDRQMCLSGRFATKLAEPFWLTVAQGATLPEGMTLEKEGEQMPMTVRFKVARKLWGQNFDGTADVSGDMTGVGNITASGHISTTTHITANGNITAKTNLYVSADTSLHRILIGNQNGDGANCPPIIEGVNGYLRIGSGTSWSGGGTLNIAAVFHSSGVTIHKALLPSEDNAKTLGTSSKRWSEMYAAKAIVSELRIGDAVISWDATNNALKVSKTLYSEGGISAMGMSGTAISGGGASYASVGWDAIKTQGQDSEMTTLATAYAARMIWDETQSNRTLINGIGFRVNALESRMYASLTINGTIYDPTGSSKIVNITAASIGALTAITKAMVEGVLTGNITSHTHSQYLTTHQSIHGLTIKGGSSTATEYDPKSAAKTLTIEGGSGITVSAETDKLTIANTYSYTHPTHTATTITAAAGKVLSAISVNTLGHVTSVASKSLTASDIPDIDHLTHKNVTIVADEDDTTENWGAHKIHVAGLYGPNHALTKPSAYGLILNIARGVEVHQLWMTQQSGSLYHRGGNANGWSAFGWMEILDSRNFINHALKIDGSNGTAAGVSALINKLGLGTSTPQDGDYYVSQYAGGGTATTTYYRRPMSAMYDYITGKADTRYVTLATSQTITGVKTFTSGRLNVTDSGELTTVIVSRNTGRSDDSRDYRFSLYHSDGSNYKRGLILYSYNKLGSGANPLLYISAYDYDDQSIATNCITINGKLNVRGEGKLTGNLTAKEITCTSLNTTNKKIYFGDTSHYIELTANGLFHFSHGLYSDGSVSALGVSAGSVSGGGASTGYSAITWADWQRGEPTSSANEGTTLLTAWAARNIADSLSGRIDTLGSSLSSLSSTLTTRTTKSYIDSLGIAAASATTATRANTATRATSAMTADTAATATTADTATRAMTADHATTAGTATRATTAASADTATTAATATNATKLGGEEASKYVKTDDLNLNVNSHCGRKLPYYSLTDNGLYAADKRFAVTAVTTSTANGLQVVGSTNVDALFDSNYEGSFNVAEGHTSVIEIDLTKGGTLAPETYSAGEVIVSFYYTERAEGMPVMEAYVGSSPLNASWQTLTGRFIQGNLTGGTWILGYETPINYLRKLRLTVVGKKTSYAEGTRITQIEWKRKRGMTADSMPVMNKYGDQTTPYAITARNLTAKADGIDSASVKAINGNGTVGIHVRNNRGLYDFTSDAWMIGGNASNTFLMKGSVGVGTMTPTCRLDVYGNLRVGGAAAAYLHANSISTTVDYINLFVSSSNGTDQHRPLVLQHGFGNVGIGIAAPTAKLHVNGSLTAGATSLTTLTASGLVTANEGVSIPVNKAIKTSGMPIVNVHGSSEGVANGNVSINAAGNGLYLGYTTTSYMQVNLKDIANHSQVMATIQPSEWSFRVQDTTRPPGLGANQGFTPPDTEEVMRLTHTGLWAKDVSTGELYAESDAIIEGDLDLGGGLTLGGDLDIGGDLTANAATLADVDVMGALNVYGSIHALANMWIDTTLNVAGLATLNGGLKLGSGMSIVNSNDKALLSTSADSGDVSINAAGGMLTLGNANTTGHVVKVKDAAYIVREMATVTPTLWTFKAADIPIQGGGIMAPGPGGEINPGIPVINTTEPVTVMTINSTAVTIAKNLAVTGISTLSGAVTAATTLTVLGLTTTQQINANGVVFANNGLTVSRSKTITIGGATISWDDTNKCLVISTTEQRSSDPIALKVVGNFCATGAVTALA